MKSIIIAVALTIASQASAQDVCAEMEAMTYEIAMARMEGVTLSSAMGIINKDGDQAAAAVIKSIILGAYALPVMMDDGNRKTLSTEYATKVALMCYNAKVP